MPWMTLLTFGFKIIGFMMDKSKANKEQKQAFLNFYNNYKEMGNSSLKQYDDLKKQMDDLTKE